MPKVLSAAEELAIRNIKGVSFGPPPDPSRPKPRFIGMPASRFNAVCAERIYRDRILLDNDARASIDSAARRMYNDGEPLKQKCGKEDNLVDMVPSKGNIERIYARLGFTYHPTTFRVLAPEFQEETQAEPSDRPRTGSGASVRSGRSQGSRKNVAAAAAAAAEGLGRTDAASLDPKHSETRALQRTNSAPGGSSRSGQNLAQQVPGLPLSPMNARAAHVEIAHLIRSFAQSTQQ
jgi:hypothetical protein